MTPHNTEIPKAAARTHKRTKRPATRPSHEEIAKLAERYWAERGCPQGSPEEDWIRAERELMGKAS